MEKKKFHCDLFGKNYSTKFNLKSHINFVHIPNMGFFCICGKRFKKPADLMHHQRTSLYADEEEKEQGIVGSNYYCDICNQLFSRKDVLLRHYKTIKQSTKVKLNVAEAAAETKRKRKAAQRKKRKQWRRMAKVAQKEVESKKLN